MVIPVPRTSTPPLPGWLHARPPAPRAFQACGTSHTGIPQHTRYVDRCHTTGPLGYVHDGKHLVFEALPWQAQESAGESPVAASVQLRRRSIPVLGQQPRVDLAAVGAHGPARRLAEDTLARRRRVLGDSHPGTLSSANNLAHVLRLQGEYAEARRLDEDTLRRREEVLGENHPDAVASANNLIVDLLELGDSERARHLDERIGRSEPGDQ